MDFTLGKNITISITLFANAFLGEAQQLWVTRVLGLSGYQAGTAWNITLDAGLDTTTVGASGAADVSTDVPFTGSSYLGLAIGDADVTGVLNQDTLKVVMFSQGQYVHSFTATTYVVGSGTVTDSVQLYTGTSLTEYEGMVLAVIRSRGVSTTPVNLAPATSFSTDGLVIDNNLSNPGSLVIYTLLSI